MALLAGASLEEAAEAAGVSRRTLIRWRHAPEFQARLRTISDDAFSHARDMLRASLPRAVATMTGFLASTDDGIKLRAAAALLRWIVPDPTREGVEAPHGQGAVVLLPADGFEEHAAAFVNGMDAPGSHDMR